MENIKNRILIIETDGVGQKTFEQFAKNEKLPYDYIITGSVSEAKQVLEKEKFEVVLINYMVQEDAAFDLFSKVKEIPFIIVIRAGEEEIAIQAIKCGAYDYLIKDAEGNYPKTLLVTVENVIRRRCLQQKLQESEEKYRNLFENAQVGMFRTKLDGSVMLAVNNKLAEIFGYSVEKMLAEPTTIRWVNPKDREEMLRQLRETGRLTDYVVPILTKGGGIKTVLASIKLYPKEGHLEGLIVDITEQRKAEKALKKAHNELEIRVKERTADIIKANEKLRREITERKWTEAELQKTRNQLEERVEERTAQLKAINMELQWEIWEHKRAEEEIRKFNEVLEQRVIERTAELEAVNKELKEFAYVVSHDLKAPLRAVSQLAHWILQDYGNVFDDDGKEQMELLVARVKRMDNLINGILQYSRVGRVKGKEEQLNLNHLVKDIIEIIAPPDNIQVTIENELPIILGDVTRIEQVFLNLLSNAIKFMDKSRGEVRIGCIDKDTHWRFSVADNGPGIDMRYYEKIFQIFQTLASRDERESTGIGLSLVKKIVELYGGKIWVESKMGEGSTFYFTLTKKEKIINEE